MSHIRLFVGAMITIGLLALMGVVGGYAVFGLLFWLVFVILWAIGAIGQPPSRPCPRCGERVRNGIMECSNCAFDFQTI